MNNELDLIENTGRPRININDIPKLELDAIFDKMENDQGLIEQLNKIDSRTDFDEKKKLLFSKYRIQVAFEKYYFDTEI
jgi:hypothetical protein